MKSALAKARDKWLLSDEAKKCCEGQASGQFLRNRLVEAFKAGWDACEKNKEQCPPQKPAQRRKNKCRGCSLPCDIAEEAVF